MVKDGVYIVEIVNGEATVWEVPDQHICAYAYPNVFDENGQLKWEYQDEA